MGVAPVLAHRYKRPSQIVCGTKNPLRDLVSMGVVGVVSGLGTDGALPLSVLPSGGDAGEGCSLAFLGETPGKFSIIASGDRGSDGFFWNTGAADGLDG